MKLYQLVIKAIMDNLAVDGVDQNIIAIGNPSARLFVFTSLF